MDITRCLLGDSAGGAQREGGKNADLLIPLGEEKRSEFEVKF